MLNPELRHRHSGLNGDGEKIRYVDLEGAPAGGSMGPFCGYSDRASGTGTQTITGVGFKPKMILIQAIYAASDGSRSCGQATSTGNEYCDYEVNQSGSYYTLFTYQPGYIIRVENYTGSLISRAQLASIDDDGFTLDWVSVGIPVNFKYQCFG